MKHSIVLAALTALAATQSLPRVPTCSKLCIDDVLPHVNCNADDWKCLCAIADDLDDLITPCLKAECSQDDEDEFREVGWEFCATIGEPITSFQVEMDREIEDRQAVASTSSSYTLTAIIVPDEPTSTATASMLTGTAVPTTTAPFFHTSGVLGTPTSTFKILPSQYTGAAEGVKPHGAVVAGVMGLAGLIL